MDFKDLNEINFLSVKTDFLLDIREQGENISKNLNLIYELGIDYNTVFKMVLRAIEMLKGELSYNIIETMILDMNKIYKIEDEKACKYIDLLECYSRCDIEKYDLKNIYTDDFANNAILEFNMMFAPYYLNMLIERYGDIDEINRVNCILKNTISQFKTKYGRN